MTSLLHRLAQHGDINWLSYYFAEFVTARDGGADTTDSLLGYSAALVSEASLAGHVCVELDQLSERALFRSSRIDSSELPSGPGPLDWCATLLASSCVGGPNQHCPLIVEDTRLYMNRFWFYENFVAARILSMLQRDPVIDNATIETRVETLFASRQDLDRDQKQAVVSAAGNPFSVISGGPGSGKTSTVIRILAVMLALNPDYRIALAAPTGKAAARMLDSIRQRIDQLGLDDRFKSALPREAKTIHRLLGYRQQGFSYHQRHQLPLDCVIVDEASMIDLRLMYQLLAALPRHAQLILLGDRDQLASVAAGNVLGDITGHGRQTASGTAAMAQATCLLRSNYRFSRDSAIAELAGLVNHGDDDAALELLQRNERGLHWFDVTGDQLHEDARAWLYDAYQPVFDSVTPAQALEAYEKTRLLCATNHGPFGIYTLNRMISEAMLKHNQLAPAEHYSGLPIMITRNFRELDLFNGDTGMLWSFDGELRACFRRVDGSIRDLSVNRLPEFKPAWASTVHKSQGSEFDSVLLVLPEDVQAEVLSRELLYTAITRARHRFLLHAPRQVVAQAIRRIIRRHSGLALKLGWR